MVPTELSPPSKVSFENNIKEIKFGSRIEKASRPHVPGNSLFFRAMGLLSLSAGTCLTEVKLKGAREYSFTGKPPTGANFKIH